MYKLFVVLLLLISCTSIQKRSSPYIVWRSNSWMPLELAGKESNLDGFTSDLFLTIAEKENISFRLSVTHNKQLFQALDDGNADAIISTANPTTALQRDYHFSEPYFGSGIVIVVRSGSSIRSIQDLQNRVVGFHRNGNVALLVQQTEGLLLQPYDSIGLAFEDVSRGQIDAVIVETATAASYLTTQYAGELSIIHPPLTFTGARLVVARGTANEALIDWFNNGLETLKKSGSYQEEIEYWGLFDISTLPNTKS